MDDIRTMFIKEKREYLQQIEKLRNFVPTIEYMSNELFSFMSRTKVPSTGEFVIGGNLDLAIKELPDEVVLEFYEIIKSTNDDLRLKFPNDETINTYIVLNK